MNGTYKSFQELAVAMGMKVSPKKAVKRKCGNCGAPLRNVTGTNVWLCDYSKLEENELADGTAVQVFTPCENVVLS